jgi:transcriptional regulator with XRE-family HTH domain
MSTSAPRSKFSDFRARHLQNARVRAAYEDAQKRSAIVDILIRRRRLLGLTQTDVARAMGVGQPTVSGFENEGSDPRLSTLQRYARAVNASLWLQLCPEGRRVEFYFHRESDEPTPEARQAPPTPRAATWGESENPYRRHLEAVREPIPA